MTVIETEFTLPQSFGVQVTASWATRITRTGGGQEQRTQKWANMLDSLEIVYDMNVPADFKQLQDLFSAVQGRTIGWLITNPVDERTAVPGAAVAFNDVVIGTGDGAQTQFQLVKGYTFGSTTTNRKITRPKVSTVKMGVAGTEINQPADFTVDGVTGIATLTTAPTAGQQVTAGFEFRIPVRFDVDALPAVVASKTAFGLMTSSTVPIVEIRQ